jgi:hypothetical protein
MVALEPDADFEVDVSVAADDVARGKAVAHLAAVRRTGRVLEQKMHTRSSLNALSSSSSLLSWVRFFFASGIDFNPKTCSTTTVFQYDEILVKRGSLLPSQCLLLSKIF